MERIILTDEQEALATALIRAAEGHEHGQEYIGVACTRLRDERAVRGSTLIYNCRRLAAQNWTWQEVCYVNG